MRVRITERDRVEWDIPLASAPLYQSWACHLDICSVDIRCAKRYRRRWRKAQKLQRMRSLCNYSPAPKTPQQILDDIERMLRRS